MEHQQGRYIATELGRVLEDQGRMQAWLASRVGISTSSMSRIVLGDRGVSEELAQRISQALGVPLFLLFESPIGDRAIRVGRPRKSSVA